MTISLSLATSRVSGVAPLNVHFDATATTSSETSRPFHDLDYYWDWDDDDETYSKGKSGAVNCHVFDQPGTYNVLLSITEPDGSNLDAMVVITVADPDTVFATTDTICFSNDADFTGAPAGSTEVTTADFDAACATYLADGKRLLFKRGDTFTASAGTTLDFNASAVSIGAFGTGTSPDIRGIFTNNPLVNVAFDGPPLRLGSTNDECLDTRVSDLEFSYTGGGTVSALTTMDWRSENLLFYRCKAAGFVTMFNLGHENPDANAIDLNRYICVANGDYSDLRNYGVYWSGNDTALLNNSFVRTDFSTTDHEHVLRFPVWTKLVVSGNYLEGPNDDKSTSTLRARTYATASDISDYAVYSDNELAVTITWALHLGTGSSSRDERVQNVVVERNFFNVVDSARTQNFGTCIFTTCQHVTIRNNRFGMESNTVTEVTSIAIQQRGPGTELTPTGVSVYHNTYNSSVTWTRCYFVNATAHSGGNVPVANNVLYAPNCGDFREGVNNATATTNLTSDPTFVSPTDWRLQVGSAAIGYGTGGLVRRDSDSKLRSLTTPDAGAFELVGIDPSPADPPPADPENQVWPAPLLGYAQPVARP
tara:strand:+ start:251 stop:2029 length:1779 start_codon:yes stop_codon:yes gene_type:complete